MKKKLFTLIVASLFAFAGGGCTKNTNETVEKYLTEKYNDSFTFDSYETTAYFTIKKFNRIYRKVQIVKIKFLQTQVYCISDLTKNLTITMLSKSHRRYF